jgi:hypothetical protein
MRQATTRLGRVDRDQVVCLLVALMTAGACGLSIATQSFAIAVAIPAIALAAAVMPLVNAGVFVGLGLVLACNAVPGLDLTKLSLSGEVNGTDLAFLALLGFAVVRRLSAPAVAASHPLSRLLGAWSLLFLALWSVSFVRALDAGTDYLHALSIGRDFLYFGLILPFASSLVTTDDELRRGCAVVGTLSVLFAGTYIVASLGLAPPATANALLTESQGSLTRIYDSGYYLFELTLSVSFAYALLSRGRRARIASFVAAITAIALVLSLTRALYLGVVLAIVLTLVVWVVGQGSEHRLLRRRLMVAASVAAVFGAALLVTVPSVLRSGAIQSVVTRASSTTSVLSSPIATNTLAYRAHVDSLMVQTLGTHWPLGLGFLSPHTNYFPDLPHGSIRDDDLGVFNSLMTMGVVGSLMLYLVPICLLFVLLFRAHRRVQRDSFLWMGGTTWLLIALITSYSLGSLASVSGLATTAVGIGLLLARLETPLQQGYRPK